MTSPNRLVLGGAQLGMAYGVANRNTGAAAAEEILALAETAGVTTVDTAAVYGTSETAVGRYLSRHPRSGLRVISKLHPRQGIETADQVRDAVAASVERIGRALSVFMVHDETLLEQWEGPLGEGLTQARDEGLTDSLGISVYTPEAFARALEQAAISHVQAPYNVLDRRVADRGLLVRARDKGVTVHLRSIFLQGLLLMEELPGRLAFAGPSIRRFHAVCRRHAVTPAAAALAFALAAAPQTGLVLGCDTAGQLRENLRLMTMAGSVPAACLADLAALPEGDISLINPALWPAGTPSG